MDEKAKLRDTDDLLFEYLKSTLEKFEISNDNLTSRTIFKSFLEELVFSLFVTGDIREQNASLNLFLNF